MAIPFKPEWKDTRKTIIKLLKNYKITPYVADEDVTMGRDILCKVCEKITFSDFGVLEISESNPNVMIEFGLTLGRRKPVFILYNKKTETKNKIIPVDITALDRIEYSNQDMLAERFDKGLQKYLQRLDMSKRRIMTLGELAKASAIDGDLSYAESVVEAISNVVHTAGKRDGLLVDVVRCLYENSDLNTFEHLKYGAVLMRLLSENGDTKGAMEMLHGFMAEIRKIVISGYQNRHQVEKPTAQRNLTSAKRALRRERMRPPLYLLLRDLARSQLDVFYQELWRLFWDLGKNRVIFLKHITEYVIQRYRAPAFRYIYWRRIFWENPMHYALIAWILNSPKLEAKTLNIRFGSAKRRINKALASYLSELIPEISKRKSRIIA